MCVRAVGHVFCVFTLLPLGTCVPCVYRTRSHRQELEKLERPASGVSSRVRFMCTEVLELRKAKWVPRREGNTVKKIDEIRAQAEAELGMISSVSVLGTLPLLPAQQRYGVDPSGGFGGRAGGDDILPLIPPLRSGGGPEAEVALFPAFRGEAATDRFSGSSALLGDYKPPVVRVQLPMARPEPTPVAQAPEPVRAPR